MIKVTRLNTSQVVVNAEMIEFVEAIPDTIISMISGKKLMVAESVDTVIGLIIQYRQRCGQPLSSGLR
ncbi:MAG: flagellar FlbD family protein [Candidatus Latescibacterota bacterium]